VQLVLLEILFAAGLVLYLVLPPAAFLFIGVP
jgi:hypothetical protein